MLSELSSDPYTPTQSKKFLDSFSISPGTEYVWFGSAILLAHYLFFTTLNGLALHFIRYEKYTGVSVKAMTPEDGNEYLEVRTPGGVDVVQTRKRVERAIPSRRRTCVVTLWSGKENHLLRGATALFEPGRMAPLMGATGAAGNTMLIDVIAGRKAGGRIVGDIIVNGEPKNPANFSHITAYYVQTDVHSESATIYDALVCSVNRIIAANVPEEAVDQPGKRDTRTPGAVPNCWRNVWAGCRWSRGSADTVDDLKDVIKEKNPATITCDAKDLKLSLAKTADGAWLPSNDPDVVAMRSGAVSEKVQNLLNGQIDPAEEISDVFVPAPQKKQIHVLVVVPDKQQAASIKKQLRYKGMSTEASCRKFLDALAQTLAKLYDFDCSFGDDPTIGDVFKAVQNNDWGFRLKRGEQLTVVELPNYFTEDEWNDLKDLNRRTNRRIHDGKVPTTSKGKPYIILPHAIYSGDRVDRYKDIATKASVVWEPTEFEVKDEDEFSGSSRSSCGRSDGA
ncbi:unnamed protein product [Phytophthora fragariaefolia]|uniref:Unnamed protein product n=1 Tax=Phytophthora fragariaefolia TaxID=1490495 RepID=A0A9W6U8G0_9STRA|nr:unnamed protein product [Phytophthora fragariaefolia]